jgi:hypothetical protein
MMSSVSRDVAHHSFKSVSWTYISEHLNLSRQRHVDFQCQRFVGLHARSGAYTPDLGFVDIDTFTRISIYLQKHRRPSRIDPCRYCRAIEIQQEYNRNAITPERLMRAIFAQIFSEFLSGFLEDLFQEDVFQEDVFQEDL